MLNAKNSCVTVIIMKYIIGLSSVSWHTTPKNQSISKVDSFCTNKLTYNLQPQDLPAWG